MFELLFWLYGYYIMCMNSMCVCCVNTIKTLYYCGYEVWKQRDQQYKAFVGSRKLFIFNTVLHLYIIVI